VTERPDITIVGLGPGDPDRITVGARRALDEADRIFVRKHPELDLSGLLDLDRAIDIAPLRTPDGSPRGPWTSAARALCDAAMDGPIVIAIPGHPRFGEGLTLETVREAHERGQAVEVLDGISVMDLVAAALDVDPLLSGVQCFAGRIFQRQIPDDPFGGGAFNATSGRPILFTHVYDAATMAVIARSLGRIFPASHEVIRVDAAGLPEQAITRHTVGELADVPAGPMIALWVPALPSSEASRDARAMQQVSARLRRPDGCPWDRVQTHESLVPSMLDEVYEVVDAIESGDAVNLAEELGDLFLHIVLQAQIAEEAGDFTLEDVYEGVAAKIVRRHPHVFAGEIAETEDDLHRIWHRVKAEEKATATHPKPEKDVDGSPFSKPALGRVAAALRDHPLPPGEAMTPEARADSLMRAIADIVQAGDDPEVVLRDALRAHLGHAKSVPGETAG
jgi:tetrapyrrole methylase family protein / MazG family protein